MASSFANHNQFKSLLFCIFDFYSVSLNSHASNILSYHINFLQASQFIRKGWRWWKRSNVYINICMCIKTHWRWCKIWKRINMRVKYKSLITIKMALKLLKLLLMWAISKKKKDVHLILVVIRSPKLFFQIPLIFHTFSTLAIQKNYALLTFIDFTCVIFY